MNGRKEGKRALSAERVAVFLLVASLSSISGIPASAQSGCVGEEFCEVDSGAPVRPEPGPGECWDDEFGDTCNEPPPPCPPSEAEPGFEFIDNQDGLTDGQIIAVGSNEPFFSCGVILVEKTGYYRIFDVELSESCDDQVDETGYLTVHNSCNPDGWAAEANQGKRYLVLDSDNTGSCAQDSDCGAGLVCRARLSHGRCCVPDAPTFMGTFFLIEGEENQICIRSWCPEYRELVAQGGKDPGFVTSGCTGSANSIHFRIDQNVIACEEDTTLMNCSFGCEQGACLPDPCDAMDCPQYCKDGECIFDNPCQDLGCAHGCKNGRCLQPPTRPGPDDDGDGYPFAADCDDTRAEANPGQSEICDNGLDDDCDNIVDNAHCSDAWAPGGGGGSDGFQWPEVDGGSGAEYGLGVSGTGNRDKSGGCSLAPPANRIAPLLLFVVVLGLLRRRMWGARGRRG